LQKDIDIYVICLIIGLCPESLGVFLGVSNMSKANENRALLYQGLNTAMQVFSITQAIREHLEKKDNIDIGYVDSLLDVLCSTMLVATEKIEEFIDIIEMDKS